MATKPVTPKKAEKFLQEEIKDHHQILTNKIIEKMEEAVKYEKPWVEAVSLPYNPQTGSHYKGINLMSLLVAGYVDNRFFTFNGIKTMALETGENIHVKKGEKGIPVFKALQQTFTKTDEASGEESRFGIWKQVYAGTVFNASQIEGLPKDNTPQIAHFETHDELKQIMDAMIQKSGLKIEHANIASAFYTQDKDKVVLPEKENFKSEAHYYRTLMHELVHSTGHPSRLDRKLKNSFGSVDYSKEELVAELGSYFMGAHLGLPYDGAVHENHAAYLKSWLKILKEDKNAIFKASSAASKAVEFQLSLKNEFLNQPEVTTETKKIKLNM